VEVVVDAILVVSKATPGRGTASGTAQLEPGRGHTVIVRYAHEAGAASLHVTWSGPGFTERVLEPSSHPEGI
jgi:hypothetical protein